MKNLTEKFKTIGIKFFVSMVLSVGFVVTVCNKFIVFSYFSMFYDFFFTLNLFIKTKIESKIEGIFNIKVTKGNKSI